MWEFEAAVIAFLVRPREPGHALARAAAHIAALFDLVDYRLGFRRRSKYEPKRRLRHLLLPAI